MERCTLIWALGLKDNSIPQLGYELDVSLEHCYKRIRGIWESFELSVVEPERMPIVWMYQIKDEYGRIIDADQLINGSWMDRNLISPPVIYPD